MKNKYNQAANHAPPPFMTKRAKSSGTYAIVRVSSELELRRMREYVLDLLDLLDRHPVLATKRLEIEQALARCQAAADVERMLIDTLRS